MPESSSNQSRPLVHSNSGADDKQHSPDPRPDRSTGLAVPRAIKKLLSVSASVNKDDGVIDLDLDGDGAHNGFFRRARARMSAKAKQQEPESKVFAAQSDAESESELTVGGESWRKRRRANMREAKQMIQSMQPDARRMRRLAQSSARVEARGVPAMNIVMFIVGSRGDVQPYIALALALVRSRGHRVRIASHGPHRKSVEDACKMLKGETMRGVDLQDNLDFYDAGGDPEELMAYMVKNPGLIPGMDSLKNGDIDRKQDMTAEYIRGFYRSTYSPSASGRPFAADAIISNPPVFAHIHIAEALGLPLLMSFTMPWTPTVNFSHPLVNLGKNTADKFLANYISFVAADALMWQGLGPIINEFRQKELQLAPLPDRFAEGVLDRLEIPWTYCWSPGLLPRPRVWRNNIDVTGFYFLENAKSYTPPKDLARFLEDGKPPVYIGFGSVVIPDPEKVTQMIVDAQQSAGVRLIVSTGWAKLGDGRENSDEVFWLREGVPHDWLFAEERVSAVCHHGGAGTTAIGLKLGRPTIVVPFFGDQKFWGNHVHSTGAGPAPIPYKKLSTELLASAFLYVSSDTAREAAAEIGRGIEDEHGEQRGVESFHRNMPLIKMRCDVDPSRAAVWYHERSGIRLSSRAAGVLVAEGKLTFDKLQLHRSKEHDTHHHHRDPLRGARDAFFDIFGTAGRGVVQMFSTPGRGAITIVYGVPKAILSILGDVYEGLDNIPALIGSSMRRKRPVVDFKSGLEQGVMGAAAGIWDGLMGLLVEPIDGAMRQGVVGVPLGFLRAGLNFPLRTVTGCVGLVVHPVQGAGRQLYALATKRPIARPDVLRAPRTETSVSEARAVGAEERAAILAGWKKLRKQSDVRRSWGRRGRKLLLVPNKEERKWKTERGDLKRVYKAGEHPVEE